MAGDFFYVSPAYEGFGIGSDSGEPTYYLTRGDSVLNVAPDLAEVQAAYPSVIELNNDDQILVKLANGSQEWWEVSGGAPARKSLLDLTQLFPPALHGSDHLPGEVDAIPPKYVSAGDETALVVGQLNRLTSDDYAYTKSPAGIGSEEVIAMYCPPGQIATFNGYFIDDSRSFVFVEESGVFVPLGGNLGQEEGGGGGDPEPAPLPLNVNISYWQEAQAGQLGYDAKTSSDTTTVVDNGTASLVTGYDNLPAVHYDGDVLLGIDAADDLNPLTVIDGPFWIALRWRHDADAPTNNCAFYNGGHDGEGLSLTVKNEGTDYDITVTVDDGGGFSNVTFTGGNNPNMVIDDDWNIGILTFDGVDKWGWSMNGMTPEIKTQAISLPFVPTAKGHANGDFALGSRGLGSASLGWKGDLSVMVGDGVLTQSHTQALVNLRRGRSYAAFVALSESDSVSYPSVYHVKEDSFWVNFKVKRPVTIEVFNVGADGRSRGTSVATTGQLTPNQAGYVRTHITGLTDDTAYLVVATDDQGTPSAYECFVRTMPTGLNFAFANIQDVHMGDTDLRATSQWFFGPESNDNPVSNPIRFSLQNGDWVYGDIVESAGLPYVSELKETLQDFIDTDDRFDHPTFRYWTQTTPMVSPSPSDHDLLNNNEDGTSPILAIAQQFYRLRHVSADLVEPSGSVYFDYKPNSGPFRVLVLDTRSKYLIANNQVMSVAQMNWLKTKITEAKANQEFLMVCTDMTLIGKDEPTLDPATWGIADAGQRQELIDHITSESMEDSMFFIEGDKHDAWFDAAGSNGWPTHRLSTGPTMHASGSSYDTNCSQPINGGADNWGRFTLAENGNDLDVTVDWFEGVDTVPKHTETFTLLQPTP